jgi:hypothetical protein
MSRDGGLGEWIRPSVYGGTRTEFDPPVLSLYTPAAFTRSIDSSGTIGARGLVNRLPGRLAGRADFWVKIEFLDSLRFSVITWLRRI